MTTYKIIRFYFNGGNKTLKTGLTLEEAQSHCKNPETSSRTATKKKSVERTRIRGPWFEGYEQE